MKRNEYEQRKRILDEQLRVALDLVHAGHRAQLQMLEILWRTSGGEAAEPSEAPPSPEAPLSSSPPPKQRRNAHDLYFEVLEALPQLPEDFTKHDVLRCLSGSTDRASLFRVLETLRGEGAIELKSEGSGKRPAVYHKRHEERS